MAIDKRYAVNIIRSLSANDTVEVNADSQSTDDIIQDIDDQLAIKRIA